MRKIIIALLLICSFLSAEQNKKVSPKRFTLKGDDGLIVVKGTIDDNTKDLFVKKILTSSTDTITVYIDSPGGRVDSMNGIIEHMLYSEKKFKCVASFAASAAFTILQFCDERYMLPLSAIGMSHNASGGTRGSIPKMIGELKMWDRILAKVEEKVAKRMGLTLKEYRALIANELWLDYTLALEKNAVDSWAYITCTKELITKNIQIETEVCSIFGGCKTVVKTTSACPLIDSTYK